MDEREKLTKSVVINTVLSLEERTVSLSCQPTAILRRWKIIKFESNTTCILCPMNGLHVSDEFTNLLSDPQYKRKSKEMW